jgi:hypothetical protein
MNSAKSETPISPQRTRSEQGKQQALLYFLRFLGITPIKREASRTPQRSRSDPGISIISILLTISVPNLKRESNRNVKEEDLPELEEIDERASPQRFQKFKKSQKKFKSISKEELEVVDPAFYNFCSNHIENIVYVFVTFL